MKLKLRAVASHHTADFKVLAAEGLESLTPETKKGFLQIVKSLTKEEYTEIINVILACKNKKGLEFIKAVLNKAEKSPILKQKAEQITNSIKSKSSKSNTENNKTATWADFLEVFKKDVHIGLPEEGLLTYIKNIISNNSAAAIGIILIVVAFIMLLVGGGAVLWSNFPAPLDNEYDKRFKEARAIIELAGVYGLSNLMLKLAFKVGKF